MHITHVLIITFQNDLNGCRASPYSNHILSTRFMANAELPQSSIHPNTPDPSRRPSPQHRPTSPAQLPLNPSSLNFTFPPSRQASPLAQKTGTQTQRRLRSFADVKHPPSDTTLAYVRGVPNVRSDVADNKGKGPAQVEDLGEPDVFSDEYDLCNYASEFLRRCP